MSANSTQTGLQTLDWLLIGLYAATVIGLGVYFSRKQRTTDEYFIGGGNMNGFFIGVSLFATLLSTISYLALPGESAGKGPMRTTSLLAYPFVFLIFAYAILPFYMRHRVTSAYELLEERLGLSTRLLGAVMFLALRLVWMTLLVYLAAKAMTVMLGADYWILHLDDWTATSHRVDLVNDAAFKLPTYFRLEQSRLIITSIPAIVLFTGIVSVIYTTLGGLRAVVITDFLQTVLLFGGALLVLATVTWDFRGFGWFPTTWQDNWDVQPIFSMNPKTRVTVVGSILTTLVWFVATLGGDQTTVQRFMATRDVKSARRALATQLSVSAIIGLTLFLVGFALLGYFKVHADQLPANISIIENADDLFPRYIAFHLPVGISGLVVAAMFAAAMSSLDSGVNSITAVVMTDFVDRLSGKPKSEKAHLRTAQLLALGIGMVVVMGSSYMKYIEGNITAMTSKTVELFATPIFGLFFFALFVPFAKPLGVWLGALCGTATALSISFSGPLVALLHKWFDVDPAVFGSRLITEFDAATGEQWITAEDPISFQWIAPMALLVNILVGTLACWVIRWRKT